MRIFLYSVVTLIVLLASIELTTRTVSWVSGNGFTLSLHELDPYDQPVADIYQWHPFIGFIFQANIKFMGSHPNQKDKAELFTDQYGFLVGDRGLTYNKPPNEIRIACIGGSTTANINLAFDKNWPGCLGDLIQRHFPEKKIKVINAGTPGFDTSQSIGNLALRVMPFHPDIVIIYHAYNDLKAIRPEKTFRPDYSHIHTTPYGFHKEPNFLTKLLHKSMLYVRTRNRYREYIGVSTQPSRPGNSLRTSKRLSYVPQDATRTFEQHIRNLVAIANAGGAEVILSTFGTLHNPNWDWSIPETFDRLTDFQKENFYNILQFTPGLTVEGIFNGLLQYNDVLKEVAIQEKCGLVDSANLIPHKDTYFVDRVHFSELGARKMAENLFPEVLKFLKGTHLSKPEASERRQHYLGFLDVRLASLLTGGSRNNIACKTLGRRISK